MEDAMQLDLVDYIAHVLDDDDVGQQVSRSLGSDGCVQNEHKGIFPEIGPCVQNEHKGVALEVSSRVQNEHRATFLPIVPCVHFEHSPAARPLMSSHRLLVCLSVLGWSERELARRLDRHQTTVRRWTHDSRGFVDPDVAEWLETLVGFHIAHPAPRFVAGIASQAGKPVPALSQEPGLEVAYDDVIAGSLAVEPSLELKFE